MPCSTCSRLQVVDQCIYGFQESDENEWRGNNEKGIDGKTQRIDLSSEATVFKSRSFFPFFTNTINNRLLTSKDGHTAQLDSTVFKRNQLTNFDKFTVEPLQLENIFKLLPDTKTSMLLLLDVYFNQVHPVIPLLNQSKISSSIVRIYDDLEEFRPLDISKLLLIFAILFSVSYSNMSAGKSSSLTLCKKYYSAFSVLMDKFRFPTVPSLESLQGFTIVNFVMDPNMVDATAHSVMLLKIAQQLGLHKMTLYKETDDECFHLRMLWHYLLFIEGSSSVVSGLPFLSTESLFQSVELPVSFSEECDTCCAFANGRFLINNVFREIMHYSNQDCPLNQDALINIWERITILYSEINGLCSVIKTRAQTDGEYFASTLYIFLFRIHLRYNALLTLNTRKDEILHKTKKSITVVETLSTEDILGRKEMYDKTTIKLSLLLLFYTYKRLIQPGCAEFSWYTKGSTVMQYLFVVIKDIYQTPDSSYDYSDSSDSLLASISDDIKECIAAGPVCYKFVLVDEVMKIMKLKLAPLWTNDDLNKFLLVKSVKKRVWNIKESFIQSEFLSLKKMYQTRLFSSGKEHLNTIQSVDFEDYMRQWEVDKAFFDTEKVLINWLSDF